MLQQFWIGNTKKGRSPPPHAVAGRRVSLAWLDYSICIPTPSLGGVWTGFPHTTAASKLEFANNSANSPNNGKSYFYSSFISQGLSIHGKKRSSKISCYSPFNKVGDKDDIVRTYRSVLRGICAGTGMRQCCRRRNFRPHICQSSPQYFDAKSVHIMVKESKIILVSQPLNHCNWEYFV